MTSLIMIVISTALINNVVLNQFLGICSFLGVSRLNIFKVTSR